MATRYVISGAAGDTGNLGVSALSESILHTVAETEPRAHMLVLDNGRRRRTSSSTFGVSHQCDGAWNSRRLYRAESLWNLAASSHSPISFNRNDRAIREATAVLDISGGDSFTDLYGRRRWQAITLPKLAALRVRTPLVLLPQTYGPFSDPKHRDVAIDIISAATMAWSRDPAGIEFLRELLGARFDPSRHREGVDVAFALPPAEPASLPSELAAILERTDRGNLVGLNVSGLIMNDPDGSRQQFNLTLDYRRTVHELASRLLDDAADRLVLVPHVRGHGTESDDRACAELAQILDHSDRVTILPPGLSASETKWCISRLDWFCGTRMHSTIAALSSGVPAAAIAYSDKTLGVFGTCGMEHAVVDARASSSGDAADRLMELAARRDTDRTQLSSAAPAVVQRARAQFETILSTSRRTGHEPRVAT